MSTDFPTAPLAPGHKGAGGGAVEKSHLASHTKNLTLPIYRHLPRGSSMKFALSPRGEAVVRWSPPTTSSIPNAMGYHRAGIE